MISSDTIYLAVGLTSILLGVLAIGLSVWFFILTKGTEQRVSNSLTKIETQTQSLERITGKLMERFTRYFTDQRPQSPTESLPEILTIVAKISQGFTSSIQERPSQNVEALLTDLVSAYIAIYYYTAITNYYVQWFLPTAAEFDVGNPLHKLDMNVTDMSHKDFLHMAKLLNGIDQGRLAQNPLSHLLEEAMTAWKDHVKSSSQVFTAKPAQ